MSDQMLGMAIEASRLLRKVGCTDPEIDELKFFAQTAGMPGYEWPQVFMATALRLEEQPGLKAELVAHARKPKDVRQLETELLEAIRPVVENNAKHYPDRAALIEVKDAVRAALRKLFSEERHYLLNRALAEGVRDTGNAWTISCALLVEIMRK